MERIPSINQKNGGGGAGWCLGFCFLLFFFKDFVVRTAPVRNNTVKLYYNVILIVWIFIFLFFIVLIRQATSVVLEIYDPLNL